MPRPPNEKSIEAQKLWKKGKKLVEIAKRLDVPAATVRRWKCTQDWEGTKKKENERSDIKKTSVRKRGAPFGNKNAVGGKGNPHPNPPPDMTKHGGYSQVYWDTLDEDEKALIEGMPKDEEMLLIEQIQLCAIRERRIMKAINKYRNKDNGKSDNIAISDIERLDMKRTFKSADEEEQYNKIQENKVKAGEILPGKPYRVTTHTTNADFIILRLEQELSSVQNKKTKAIEALAKLRLEKQKQEQQQTGNEAVNDWIAAVMEDDNNE